MHAADLKLAEYGWPVLPESRVLCQFRKIAEVRDV